MNRFNVGPLDASVRPERELIDEIIDIVSEDPEGLLKLGRDDASARKLGEGVYVFKMDMVSSSTDLLPGMSLRQLAKKCVVSNFSDVASKGARPLIFMTSIGLPSHLSDEDFRSIFLGLEDAMRKYGTYLIGGDLGESEEVVISGFAFGKVVKRLVERRGAKPGDLIATTGPFGFTWFGFKYLLEGMELPEWLKSKALKSVYEPEARVEEGIAISNYATSSIDSSDGLYWSLKELSRASGYGFLVEYLPLDEEVRSYIREEGIDPVGAVFHGGEEYEIVFTVEEERLSELRDELLSLGADLLLIGRVIEPAGVYLRVDGACVEVPEGGWEHFRRSK